MKTEKKKCPPTHPCSLPRVLLRSINTITPVGPSTIDIISGMTPYTYTLLWAGRVRDISNISSVARVYAKGWTRPVDAAYQSILPDACGYIPSQQTLFMQDVFLYWYPPLKLFKPQRYLRSTLLTYRCVDRSVQVVQVKSRVLDSQVGGSHDCHHDDVRDCDKEYRYIFVLETKAYEAAPV